MLFDLTDQPLLWIPVRWPGLKAGEGDDAVAVPTEHEIELRVELLDDKDEVVSLFPGMFGKEEEPALDELGTFKRIVRGWRKIVAHGSPLPFEDEHILKLLKRPMFGAAFANAYVAALGGRIEVREGNSNGSPSGGRADEPKPAATTNSGETASGSA